MAYREYPEKYPEKMSFPSRSFRVITSWVKLMCILIERSGKRANLVYPLTICYHLKQVFFDQCSHSCLNGPRESWTQFLHSWKQGSWLLWPLFLRRTIPWHENTIRCYRWTECARYRAPSDDCIGNHRDRRVLRLLTSCWSAFFGHLPRRPWGAQCSLSRGVFDLVGYISRGKGRNCRGIHPLGMAPFGSGLAPMCLSPPKAEYQSRIKWRGSKFLSKGFLTLFLPDWGPVRAQGFPFSHSQN